MDFYFLHKMKSRAQTFWVINKAEIKEYYIWGFSFWLCYFELPNLSIIYFSTRT